jgi:leucyl aminopeptidase
MQKRSTNEFLVMYFSDLTTALNLTSNSCKTWNPAALKQLNVKIGKAKEAEEYKERWPLTIKVHFQNGSIAKFLFIDDQDFSTFSLHEALRDSFFLDIKESENISFNIRKLNTKDQKRAIDALSSLVTLSSWEPPFYGKREPKKKIKRHYGFYSGIDPILINSLMEEAELKAEGTNLVRTLAMMPGNMLTSKKLVSIALKEAKKLKLKGSFLSTVELEKLGAGAFSAVVQASKSEGGIVTINRPGTGPKIALVGKGLVYDTGGHDLKVDSSMLGMHRDMTGSAVALATFSALVKSEDMKNLDLTVYLGIAENMISPAGYKAGDVIKALNGETIEIENTDAEGRLVLADTLVLASKEKPNLIIDFATLTGAATGVLGTGYSIAMTNTENLGPKIIYAGNSSGERVWHLPIAEEFRDEVNNSEVADLTQCTNQDAEHGYAAAFLTHFVPEDIKHVHVDLASESNEDGLGLVNSDVTGFGVRWAFQFIKSCKNHLK